MPTSPVFVTQEHFDSVITEKFDSVMEKLDLLLGKYRDHEEEHILLNAKVSEHSDDLEIIKEQLHIQQ